ncbi:hypothetical protein Hanom_Chr13g01194231 [Helianthus anomalus]
MEILVPAESKLISLTLTLKLLSILFAKTLKIIILILKPESKRGRPPIVLRLTVFFGCRFRSRSYLLELILDPSSCHTLVALISGAHRGASLLRTVFRQYSLVPKLSSLMARKDPYPKEVQAALCLGLVLLLHLG